MPFITQLDLEALDDDTGTWRLNAPLVYEFPKLGIKITVPAGFVTDLASIPALMQWLFPVNETYRKEAVLHDYLYSTQEVPRSLADEILKCAMEEADIDNKENTNWRATKRWMIWAGVRIGGWVRWNKG